MALIREIVPTAGNHLMVLRIIIIITTTVAAATATIRQIPFTTSGIIQAPAVQVTRKP